jgi:serine/threonine protein kinase
MIDRLGTVKLVDFGRAVITGESLTFLLGAPMYMAPETHRRESSGVPADLYSTGIVTLEMLCGRQLPDRNNADEEALLRVKTTLPDNLESMLPEETREGGSFLHVLRTLLDPDPGKRYPNARTAAAGSQGIAMIEKELTARGVATEYSRELSDYLALLINPDTDRMDLHGLRECDPSRSAVIRPE